MTKWFALTGDIGIASAVNKRISEAKEPSAYFSAGLLIAAGLSGILLLIIVLAREYINSYIGVDAWVFVGIITPLAVLYSIIASSLKGERRVHLVALLTPTQTIGRSLVQVGLVFFGLGLTGMIFGYIAGILFATALAIWFISLDLTIPEKDKFANIYSFAKYSWLGNLRGRSFNDIDVLVLGLFVAPELVGVYSVAWGITSFIGIFGSSLRNTLFPELSYADAAGKEESLSGLVSDSLTFGGLIAIPGFFGSLTIADRLLRIYGREFTRGAIVLSLLVLAMLLYDYQSQFLNALNALDRPEISFRVNVAFITTNLVLNFVFVFVFGLIGAAVATVIAALVGLLLSFRYLDGLIEFEIPSREFSYQLLSAVVMMLVVGGTRFVVESTVANIYNAIFVVGLVALGGMSYFLTLLLVSSQFKSTVRDNSPIDIPLLS